MKTKKQRIIERVVILSVAVVVLTLLVFFLKDIFFPFIKLEIHKDIDGAKELLKSKGWLGFVTVSLVEALQMVVIFIPAEFIQLSSGMSYPWWLAIILCDVGVMLGGSIIYFLVRLFKFDGDIFNKGSKISKYEKQSKVNNAIILTYVLFIMPIIPFGAICYWLSNKKIPYWKYLIVIATGVIPSICTSIFMGAAVKLFITESLPIWALILAIIGAAALLFALLAFVLHKFFFKQSDGTPDSIFYQWSLGAAYKILKHKNRFVSIGREKLEGIEDPCLYLANHHSFFDPFALMCFNPDKHFAYVMNRYYYHLPLYGTFLKRSGFIPKRMFTNDFECTLGIIRALKAGYSVPIFPEGRLSTDGGPSQVPESVGKLVQLLKKPVVLVRISNGYFAKPKWRSFRLRQPINVEVMDVIKPEELKTLSTEDVMKRIEDVICFNEFENENVSYRSKKLAKGLENVLYMCPHCKTMYSNVTKGNTITCPHCGKTYHIKPNYQFEEADIKNIFEYYKLIKKYELENLDKTFFDIEVDTVIFEKDMKKTRKDKGVFHLDSKTMSYKSNLTDLYFEYETKEIEGLAYSVNKEFETYYNGELYYFYPSKDNRKICTRVALFQELVRERAYGKHKE